MYATFQSTSPQSCKTEQGSAVPACDTRLMPSDFLWIDDIHHGQNDDRKARLQGFCMNRSEVLSSLRSILWRGVWHFSIPNKALRSLL